jgi:hypothetical protein
MGLPSIAFSLVIQHVALRPSMIGFASVLSVGAFIAIVIARRSAAVAAYGRPGVQSR